MGSIQYGDQIQGYALSAILQIRQIGKSKLTVPFLLLWKEKFVKLQQLQKFVFEVENRGENRKTCQNTENKQTFDLTGKIEIGSIVYPL